MRPYLVRDIILNKDFVKNVDSEAYLDIIITYVSIIDKKMYQPR
jgi:hypothetical protein